MKTGFLKGRKNNLIIILMALIIFLGIFVYASPVYALTSGKVSTSDGLNMRPRASIESGVLSTLSNGTTFEILGQTKENGYLWYNIKYGSQEGYVVSDYVSITSGSLPVKQGKIINAEEGLRLRSAPDTSRDNVITYLYSDYKIKVLGKTYQHGKNDIWYYVDYNGTKGFVHSDYVQLDSGSNPDPNPQPPVPDYKPNPDFEAELTAQGFPESYKVLLRKLHIQHPNWVFKAGKTGLYWDSVIDKEFGTKGRRPNTIHNSFSDAWKSKEPGDYNPATGIFTVYDSGGYVAASRNIIKYYMDPRNFLNDDGIFQFISSAYDPALHTSSGLQSLLSGTFMSGNIPGEGESYNSVLMRAARVTGASPYTLAAMILQEQGINGYGGCISGEVSGYKGYYNYFNIGAYAGNGRDAVENGLIYAKKRGWNTRVKSILGGAEEYADGYVSSNKSTLYLKKFNVMNGLGSVGTGQYMTNIRGAYDEGRHLKGAYVNTIEAPYVFEIPVYYNMPDTIAPMPGPGWQKEEGKWYYYQSLRMVRNEWKVIDDEFYYFYPDGHMAADETTPDGYYVNSSGVWERGTWEQNGDKWKYSLGNGKYAIGWHKISGKSYYFDAEGYMVTGWQHLGSNDYYFYDDGHMAVSEWTPDGYYVNSSGEWTTDKWIQDSKGWRYRYAEGGYAKNELKKIGSQTYYFNGDGYMVTGWQKISDKTYFFNDSGYMATGWQHLGSNDYYFYDDGHMAVNERTPDGYYVNSSGEWIQDKWMQDSKGWRYRYAEGRYAKNELKKIGSRTYYFNEDGYMVTGWKKISGKWYFFNQSGFMATGWQHLGSNDYYFYDDGRMAVSEWTPDGYYVNGSGEWIRSKWIQDNKGWWYRYGDGTYPKNELKKIGSWTYYFNDNGYMATGWQKISDKWYYFDRNGHMLTGWQRLGSKDYYFHTDGHMAVNERVPDGHWVGTDGTRTE